MQLRFTGFVVGVIVVCGCNEPRLIRSGNDGSSGGADGSSDKANGSDLGSAGLGGDVGPEVVSTADAGTSDGDMTDCSGPASQACGNCGTQTRTCDTSTGIWSAWSACNGQGECAPNSSQSCGSGGTQSCGGNCKWSECGNQACPGASTQACGKCGTQTRTCDKSSGAWSAWSACSGEGECMPKSPQTCGNGGTQSCGGDCKWPTTCSGQKCAGASSQPCGNCGTQIRTCDGNSGMWSAWSQCNGQGECAPSATQSCGTAGGSQTCSATCNWGTCSCSGPTSQTCSCTGTQTRTCSSGTWSAWSACSGGTNTNTDPNNCGSCGMSCGGVRPKCASGSCVQCATDNDCSGARPNCNLNTHACICRRPSVNNLLQNPGFDVGIDSWGNLQPGEPSFSFQDADNCPESGSMHGNDTPQNTGGPPFQCIAVTPGKTYYYGALFKSTLSGSALSDQSLAIEYFSDANCKTFLSNGPETQIATPPVNWTPIAGSVQIPPGVGSVELLLAIDQADLDQVYFNSVSASF